MNRIVLLCALGALPVLVVRAARADIPADYSGKPYKGVASAIPGRVELANVDTGGAEISYHADHNRMNSAGYEPISGNDYRPDEKDLPNICKTNGTNPDHWLADGTLYPSDVDKFWYYIGYAHAVDWLKVTVNVAQAGKYNVSSNWASAGAKLGLSIWFNDGHSPVDAKHPKDGVNKSGVVVLDGTSDFHKWKSYPNFATVELSAGVQVMTFHLEQFDHLQYGFLQFDLVGGAVGSGGAGAGGAAGSDGSAGAAQLGGAGGAGGTNASVGGASSGGAAPQGGSTAASGTGGGGSPSAGSTSAGTSNLGAPQSTTEAAGCTVAVGRARGWPTALGALFAAVALLGRRRRR